MLPLFTTGRNCNCYYTTERVKCSKLCDCFSAQQVFRKALRSSVIRLRLIRPSPSQSTQTQPNSSTKATDDVNNLHNRPRSNDVKLGASGSPDTGDQKAAPPLVKIPPAVPPRSSSTSLSTAKNKFAQISSTRLIGRVMNIELTKGDNIDYVIVALSQSDRQQWLKCKIRGGGTLHSGLCP